MNLEISILGCDFDDWPGPTKPTAPSQIAYDPELDGPLPNG